MLIEVQIQKKFLNRRLDEPLSGGTRFLCGNHDFGFGAFLGALPAAKCSYSAEELDASCDPKYTTGYFKHYVNGCMHYQGRI